MKEQIIPLPDNLEVKEIKDGKIILVEKKKKLTYEDIVIELKPIISVACLSTGLEFYATSNKIFNKLHAINKLMIVAKYLNDGWQPDWNNMNELKYFISYSNKQNSLYIDAVYSNQPNNVFFKSIELANKAIEILGEKTIRLALCTNY